MTSAIRECGRVLIGVFEVKCIDGMFVAIDRQTAKPADVPPFTMAADAIAWCTKNSAKARKR